MRHIAMGGFEILGILGESDLDTELLAQKSSNSSIIICEWIWCFAYNARDAL